MENNFLNSVNDFIDTPILTTKETFNAIKNNVKSTFLKYRDIYYTSSNDSRF